MERIKNLRGFVFDFDGTLAILNIDFAAMRRDIIDLAADFELNVELIRGLYVLEMVARGRDELSKKDGVKADAFYREANRLIKEREISSARRGGMHEGSLPLLRRLGELGIRRGIITRNCNDAVRILFPEVDELCEAFFPRDRVDKVKPHPDHLLATLSCMKVEPRQAAMVGDHPMDVQCGKENGLLSVGVLTGNADRLKLEKAGACVVVNHVGEILSLIDG